MTTKFKSIHSKTASRRKMMQSGVIFRRKAGILVPDPFLSAAVKAYPHAWGAAFAAGGELNVAKGDNPTIETFKEAMADYKDEDIVFYLCNAQAGVNTDDVSPHVLIHKDDNPQLIAFIDGKFPGREQSGSSHPSSFFLANTYLIPKLQQFAELCDGDVQKIMAQIKKPIFRQELLDNALDHATIVFMDNTGETVPYTKGGGESAEFPWGWTSNHCGFSEVQKKEDPPAPAKKGMFGGKSTVREKAPVPPSPAVAGSPAIAPPPSAASIIKRYEVVQWAPQPQTSRRDRKKAYQARIGYCPKGWEGLVKVDVYKDTQTNKLLTASEVKQLGLAALGLPPLSLPEKDVSTHNIPGEKAVTAEIIPIMPPATREYIQAMLADPKVQKLIDENADIIEDPAKVQQLEQRFADFSTQLGLKTIDDFMPWSYEMMLTLGRDKPDGLAVMCWTFRNMLAARMAKDAKKSAAAETPPTEAPAPAQKKGMFGSKKVA